MKYQLERTLKLQTDVKHKSLYKWAIIEVDGVGKFVGQDQIPWVWTHYFSAVECNTRDIFSARHQGTGKSDSNTPTDNERQSINIRLRSGFARDENDDWRHTSFSMFGTGRIVENFRLEISPISDPNIQENCHAWGVVSYTSKEDFEETTQEDVLGFSLYVKPETFARYLKLIQSGNIDNIVFSVGGVSGFYSDWSPTVSTDSVKILAPGAEQTIENAAEFEIKPPRLGEVGACGLSINRQIVFGKQELQATVGDQTREDRNPPVEHEPATIIRFDPEIKRVVQSLRTAAWWMVGLLVVIALTTLLR